MYAGKWLLPVGVGCLVSTVGRCASRLIAGLPSLALGRTLHAASSHCMGCLDVCVDGRVWVCAEHAFGAVHYTRVDRATLHHPTDTQQWPLLNVFVFMLAVLA